MKSLRYETEIKKCTSRLDSHIHKLIFHQIARLTAKPSLLKESLESFEEATQYPENELVAKGPCNEADILRQHPAIESSYFPEMIMQKPTLETLNSFGKDFELSCRCTRPRVQQSWMKVVLGATFESESINMHRRGCSLYREQEEITKLLFTISFISRLVNTAAHLSVSLQRGAGGMSISPNLTLRGMKKSSLPVFALVTTLITPPM